MNHIRHRRSSLYLVTLKVNTTTRMDSRLFRIYFANAHFCQFSLMFLFKKKNRFGCGIIPFEWSCRLTATEIGAPAAVVDAITAAIAIHIW